MQNSPLAFLTSLGGKLSGEKAAGINPLAKGDAAENNGNGFFVILNRLLTAGAGEEDAPQTLSASIETTAANGSPLSKGEAKGWDVKSESPFVLTTEPVEGVGDVPLDEIAAASLNSANSELLKEATSELNDLAGALPVEAAVEASPQAAIGENVGKLVNEKIETLATPGSGVPAIKGANAKGAAPAPAGLALGLHAAQEAKAGVNPAATQTPDAESELSLNVESEGEGERPLFNPRQPQAKPSFAAPQLSQAAQKSMPEAAQAENAILSAGLDGEAPAVERSAVTRAETVPTDKAAVSFNPVRDQIVAAVVARNGEGRLEVRLDPPELGRVTINFEGDGAELVRAVISADTPETLDLMRRNADAFQRALAEQGFEGLDLQFAERGAENARQDEAEKGRAFAFGKDGEAPGQLRDDSEPAARYVEIGRLDRRL